MIQTPPPAAGPVLWVEAPQPDDDRPAVRDWMAQSAAGRIGVAVPPDPHAVAIRHANAALFARRTRERRA